MDRTTGQTDRLYIRGINLIAYANVITIAGGHLETDTPKTYYLHNFHGDVVATVNNSGVVTKRYDYEAFGNEIDPGDGNGLSSRLFDYELFGKEINL